MYEFKSRNFDNLEQQCKTRLRDLRFSHIKDKTCYVNCNIGFTQIACRYANCVTEIGSIIVHIAESDIARSASSMYVLLDILMTRRFRKESHDFVIFSSRLKRRSGLLSIKTSLSKNVKGFTN